MNSFQQAEELGCEPLPNALTCNKTMKLTGPESAFELNILDYECSDSPSFMDRNWLIVSLKTRYHNDECVRTAPMLSTWEIEMMLKWMRSVADEHDPAPRLTFVEPALGFSNLSVGPNSYQFRIRLGSDALPNWQRSKNPFYLPVCPDKSELQRAIRDLEKQLLRFPVRE